MKNFIEKPRILAFEDKKTSKIEKNEKNFRTNGFNFLKNNKIFNFQNDEKTSFHNLKFPNNLLIQIEIEKGDQQGGPNFVFVAICMRWGHNSCEMTLKERDKNFSSLSQFF